MSFEWSRCLCVSIIPSRSLGFSLGLLERHLISVPGPGSINTFVLSSESHIPPDLRSCCDTTYLAPAVPRNFIGGRSHRNRPKQ